MIALLPFLALPIAFLVVLLVLSFRGRIEPALESAGFFALAIVAGWWAIRQSRSSTAGIGLLFLPLMAMIAGLLGLASGFARSSGEKPIRIVGWVCFGAALLMVTMTVIDGAQTVQRNRSRDAATDALSAEIARYRESIAVALKQNAGRQRAYLDSSIRARFTDRAFLLAALPNDSISPDVLDTVAMSYDLGITLEAVRNPNTTAETLARVYRKKSYPDYFFQALAGHHNTPPDVLSELYRRPRTITGLAIWFAGNPSTPKEILSEIARTTSDRTATPA